MFNFLRKVLCKKYGHAASILEVHESRDLIRCSRCNTIQKTFSKG